MILLSFFGGRHWQPKGLWKTCSVETRKRGRPVRLRLASSPRTLYPGRAGCADRAFFYKTLTTHCSRISLNTPYGTRPLARLSRNRHVVVTLIGLRDPNTARLINSLRVSVKPSRMPLKSCAYGESTSFQRSLA
jgi:hypothetical protein